MQVWKIDKNNIYTGESYFVKTPDTYEIIEPLTMGYVKPKWDSVKWVEGATKEEIQEWKKSQVVKSILPTQKERIDMLENMILMMMEV